MRHLSMQTRLERVFRQSLCKGTLKMTAGTFQKWMNELLKKTTDNNVNEIKMLIVPCLIGAMKYMDDSR